MDPAKKVRASRILFLVAFLLFLGVVAVRNKLGEQEPKPITYSELVTAIEAGHVTEARVGEQDITATLTDANGAPSKVVTERLPRTDERALIDAMQKHDVAITAHPERVSWWPTVLTTLLPLLVLFVLLSGVSSFMTMQTRGRPLSFGKSKARVYDRGPETSVTFTDVAGVDEAKAELVEVVRFLKEPARYRAVGARIPKGVLLVGAPGTGKTLLAKAVAGESGVPFFSMSGSEFVEMFVGVGASRVRDLFEQAKERAPCIIFIDELDAVGKTRSGAQGFVANEEREQTLNQLLVEMDGFDSGVGLVIMAATNRPEILDKALLRAGRFDRQVVVDRPDIRGRKAILEVHSRKVALAPEVDLEIVAQRTPGMVGADLANVVNEAALASVRRGSSSVGAVDFEEAVDRQQLGLKKEGRVMTDDEKKRVAFHESGHALVALSMEHADPVYRVTIIPRSIGSLGATLQLPTEERWLMTREELRDRLCVLLGGRAAEEIACGDVSTGARDDLERATELARHMVCKFGMSDALGPMTFDTTTSPFLSLRSELGRPMSNETLERIDKEIKSLIGREYARARERLTKNRAALDRVAGELLVKETLQRADLELLARTKLEDEARPMTPQANGPAALSA